eukprot:6478210-Amphidinium_carterae.1
MARFDEDITAQTSTCRPVTLACQPLLPAYHSNESSNDSASPIGPTFMSKCSIVHCSHSSRYTRDAQVDLLMLLH